MNMIDHVYSSSYSNMMTVLLTSWILKFKSRNRPTYEEDLTKAWCLHDYVIIALVQKLPPSVSECISQTSFSTHEHLHWTNFHLFFYKEPQFLISILALVLPISLPYVSIFFKTSIPLVTFPNTTCFPFNHGVCAVQMKNWEPFVFGPALAMESVPIPPWAKSKFSSSNLVP